MKLFLKTLMLTLIMLSVSSCNSQSTTTEDLNTSEDKNNANEGTEAVSDYSDESLIKKEIEERLDEGWELVFSDEFIGDSLDSAVWSHQEGTGSQFGLNDWGNDEAQYYLEENVTLENGLLVIEAKSENIEGKSYTSGRLTTRDNYSKKYGRFEARISFPAGEGLWPAFWMLPQEEAYGTWAASGEIDIVEIRGRFPRNVNSALHYGGVWPNNEYSSTFFKLDDTVEDFHTYAVEWEPGEIRWYLDDELYYTANDWYSVSAGEIDNNLYPAPFDKAFYLLFNLAVGGTYDESRLPEDGFTSAKMLVDYVRVYELVGREYLTAEKPVEALGILSDNAKQPVDGDYVYDRSFEDEITAITSSGKVLAPTLWNIVALTDFGGQAAYEIVAEESLPLLKLDILEKGNETYAVQLIQQVPLAENHLYELTFKAKADEARNMKIKIGAGAGRGWKMYAPDTDISLTDELQTYSLRFKMKDVTDEVARLEFNCGLSDVTIYLGEISLKDLTAAVQ